MITVVMCVYNTGNYLPKAVDAMIVQTYADFELLIVDDGSTDGSGKVCDEQASRDERIHAFHKPNGGISTARNFGIDHSNGDFIIFPDPDDWVEPNYLEQLLSIREKHGVDLSICGHYVDKGDDVKVWNPDAKGQLFNREQALMEAMMPHSFCGYAWNKLYSMDVIRKNGLRFDEKLLNIEDLHFVYLYLQFCDSVYYDPTPVMHYNRGSSGVTTYDSPLTPRKLSGLQPYVSIASMAHDKYPQVEKKALGTLGDTALQYIYFYYHSHMDQPETLALLRKTLSDNLPFFLEDSTFSPQRKLLGRIAVVSPRTYCFIFQTKRSLRDTVKKMIRKK
ncbi:MAG: glycosyltransferase [Clostridiales bacterium]|nr:glycosyltransferase [Clostridiales bacterium]